LVHIHPPDWSPQVLECGPAFHSSCPPYCQCELLRATCPHCKFSAASKWENYMSKTLVERLETEIGRKHVVIASLV
jgi:hypothetical protein